MIFKNKIGMTFQENEFYELLQFELEENFEQYFSQFIHFYFKRTTDKKIKITEMVHFDSSIEMDQKSRSLIEKKEWFEISQKHNHYNLLLCRFDRTGVISLIWKESTHRQEWKHGWADERPYLGPMTREEIRQAVIELSGCFDNQMELQKLRSKKAA